MSASAIPRNVSASFRNSAATASALGSRASRPRGRFGVYATASATMCWERRQLDIRPAVAKFPEEPARDIRVFRSQIEGTGHLARASVAVLNHGLRPDARYLYACGIA